MSFSESCRHFFTVLFTLKRKLLFYLIQHLQCWNGIFLPFYLMQHLRWLLLTVLPRCSTPCVFDFDRKLSRNVAEIILYYHVTKNSLTCLNWLVTCFWFQNMFWKNINYFRFWWKTYTKRCTSNYVIARVKRLSSPSPGWSGAFNFRVWFGKQNMTVKISILTLFCIYFASCLSVVAASCFNYIGSCTKF